MPTLLQALARVRTFHDEDDCPWLRDTALWEGLHMNTTLTDIRCTESDHNWFDDPNEFYHVLLDRAIRKCLETNWFLERINTGVPDGPDAYWSKHMQPLLEKNKSHVPRIDIRERRLSVLLESLLRIQNHPTKTYLFVHAFKDVLMARPLDDTK